MCVSVQQPSHYLWIWFSRQVLTGHEMCNYSEPHNMDGGVEEKHLFVMKTVWLQTGAWVRRDVTSMFSQLTTNHIRCCIKKFRCRLKWLALEFGNQSRTHGEHYNLFQVSARGAWQDLPFPSLTYSLRQKSCINMSHSKIGGCFK